MLTNLYFRRKKSFATNNTNKHNIYGYIDDTQHYTVRDFASKNMENSLSWNHAYIQTINYVYLLYYNFGI